MDFPTAMAHYPWATTHEFVGLGRHPFDSSALFDDQSNTPDSNQTCSSLVAFEYEKSPTGNTSTPSQNESTHLEIRNSSSGQAFISTNDMGTGCIDTILSVGDQWLDNELPITTGNEPEGDLDFRYQVPTFSAQGHSNYIAASIGYPSGIPLMNHPSTVTASCSVNSPLENGYSSTSSDLECKWKECSNTKIFCDESHLKKHVRSKHIISDSSGLRCNWNGCTSSNSFSRRQTLIRHVETAHISPRQYKCPHPACNKVFGRKDRLHLHVRIFHIHLLEVCKCQSKRCDHYHARRR